MGWGIAAFIFLLIICFPVGASAKYDSDGIVVRIIAGFLRFTIIPFPKKKPAAKSAAPAKKAPPQQKQQTKPSPSKQPAESSSPKKSGGSLKDFLPLVQVGLGFLNAFRKKLRVDQLELKLIMAGDDPCDLAVNYGRAWAVIDNLLPELERFLVIRKRDLEVECDFCADQTTVIARMDLTITIGRMAGMIIKYGFLALREFLILKKKRKGGAAA